VVKQICCGNQAKTFIVKEQQDLTGKFCFLKVYSRQGKEFFVSERKILTKTTNKRWPGFPRLYSTRCDDK
jgi:hypothetical protein